MGLGWLGGSQGCPAYVRRRVRPGSDSWGLEELPRRVDGVSMRLFWPQKDCPAERYARTPRTLVARRVDVGYCVNGSAMPCSTRPTEKTDASRKNPTLNLLCAVIEPKERRAAI